MKIFAVECAAKAASCAISEDGKLLCEFYTNTKTTHSETLMPMVENALKMCKMTTVDVDIFAVAHGPGSFTGTRIGVSAVKGLAFPNDTLCISISTLEALAYCVSGRQDCIVCAVMDARCGQVYNALFKMKNGRAQRLTQDRAISVEELFDEIYRSELTLDEDGTIVVVGDGAEMFYNFSDGRIPRMYLAEENQRWGRASAVAAAAMQNLKYALPPDQLLPFYLRPSQAERQLKERREKEKQKG